MFESLKKYQKNLEYVPILLITLLFVAETELEKNAVNVSCQMAIMMACVAIFFIIAIKFKNSKTIAFFVAVILWLLLVHIKNKHINRNPI